MAQLAKREVLEAEIVETSTHDVDVLQLLLSDKRSPNTRRAYAKDIRLFCEWLQDKTEAKDIIKWFLSLTRQQALIVVTRYKAFLLERVAEATLNRRLSAIKSLVAFARKLGITDYSLEDIKGEKLQTYRDTSGIDKRQYQSVLNSFKDTPADLRDLAIFKLLWGNGLRRAEVSKINIGDLDGDRLRIFGKGRGNQFEYVTVGPLALKAIANWLKVHPNSHPDSPLFCSLHRDKGRRLEPKGIYRIVRKRCAKAGITKIVSPHRIRHSCITYALDQTDGNVRAVQKLSRHKNIDTVMRYDDNRLNLQAQVTCQIEL